MTFTEDEAEAFVRHHIEVWNTHDLSAILDLYTPEVELVSPLAGVVMGSNVVRGHDGLRRYFGAALARNPELQFEVVDVLRGATSVTIYMRSLGGRMVGETLFVEGGRVSRVLAHYSIATP